MPYPSEFPLVIYTLLGLLAILLLMIVLNFALVFTDKTATPIYTSFDKISSVFVRVFGILLLFIMIWSLLAKAVNSL